MADSEATEMETTVESQDSQQTVEYSLEEMNDSPPGDDHLKQNKAEGGKKVCLRDKDPQGQVDKDKGDNTNLQGQIEKKETANTNKDVNKTGSNDAQEQVSEGGDGTIQQQCDTGPPELVMNGASQGQKENTGPHCQVTEGENNNNIPLKSVSKEKNTAHFGEVNERESSNLQEPTNKEQNTGLPDELNEGENLGGERDEKMDIDEETGQSGSAAAQVESKHISDEDSTDDSDDDYWSRPWASRDTKMYRLEYPVSGWVT